jgi:hypothetical protein
MNTDCLSQIFRLPDLSQLKIKFNKIPSFLNDICGLSVLGQLTETTMVCLASLETSEARG